MGICSGEIKGDPDIAGTGVVAAIFINAIVAIILSIILWFYVFFYMETENVDSPSEPITHATTRHFRLYVSNKHPWWISVLRDALVMQGDSQLISGLAIVIASLVNVYKDDETPLYHIFIARALADVCLAGHSASIILIPRTEHNWWFRLGILLFTLGLWEIWSYAAIERFRRWNWETPYCLENTSKVPGDYNDWIFWSMLLIPLGYISPYLNVWEFGRNWTNKFEKLIMTCLRSLKDHSKDISRHRSIVDLLGKASLLILETLVCVNVLPFTVFIPASCTLLPVQSAISLGWDIYDVVKARAANAHIVVANPGYRPGRSFQNNDNPEHDWGFGQILPFVMLLLPILTALDYLKSIKLKDLCEKLSEN